MSNQVQVVVNQATIPTVVEITAPGPQAPASPSGSTDLSYDPATRLLSSSSGADVTLPLADATNAGLLTAAEKVLIASALQAGQAFPSIVDIRNNSGVELTTGTPVYVTSSSGIKPTVAAADASLEPTAARTLGLMWATAAHNSDGKVLTHGILSGVNTSALTEGAAIWLSETTGQLTTTRPTQPAHGVFLGFCIKQGPGTSGILYVNVINGQELNELHDVLITGSLPAEGAPRPALALSSDGLWRNTVLTPADVGAATAAVVTTSAAGLAPATGTPSGKYLKDDATWALPLADIFPQFDLALSDVANTSGDIGGSLADTGQTWLVSGDGAIAPKKPFYASDENGGYMRASDLGGGVNTYIISSIGSANCTRLRLRKRGGLATLAILKVAGSFADMIHINFAQPSGSISPSYWKTGVGSGLPFSYAASNSNPTSDPNAIRVYEVQVIGQIIACYVDGLLAGIVYDKEIPGLIGPGFYVQLHNENDRIYEIEAWSTASSPLAPGVESAYLKTDYANSRAVHVGDTSNSNYAPVGNFYVLGNSPTFRGDGATALSATFRSSGTGYGTTLNVFNAGGLGLSFVSDGAVVSRIRHQGSDRITFPANTARSDFPVAIGLASLSSNPTGTTATDGALFYSSTTGRPRIRVAGVWRDLATTNGWTNTIDAPVSFNASASASVADLLAGILTSDAAPSTPVTITLPTGVSMDAGFSALSANMAFLWSVINLDGVEIVTVAGSAGHTIVGELTIAANKSGRWASRRTAANTWISYRIS